MKYFQSQFFTRDGSFPRGEDREACFAIRSKTAASICAEYQMELSGLLPHLSSSVQKFVQQNHCFHDAPINEVKLTTEALVIEVPSGMICVSDLLDLKMDLECELANCWLYDEIVIPKPDSRLTDGYFEFNILTQNGEISVTAREIIFTPKSA